MVNSTSLRFVYVLGARNVPFRVKVWSSGFTPTELAEQYFRRIHAPRKKMVLIKGAGHFAYATNREEFLAALVKYVRPIAVSAQ